MSTCLAGITMLLFTAMFDNCIPWQQLGDCRPFLCAAKGVACETMNKDGRRENSRLT